MSLSSKIILSAVFLPIPGTLESLATSSVKIYPFIWLGVKKDNVDKPTLGPILDTEVKQYIKNKLDWREKWI